MKERIVQICKDLEAEHGIKILFAIENGSRAWRMESSDSDYDVRFVYIRPVEEYLTIRPKADVIQIAFDEEGNRMGAEGSFIDASGFDIFKFCSLLSKSNPTCIEWLTTDMVYYGEQNTAFREWALAHFNPVALYYHYKSLSKNNFRKYISSKNDVTHKRYLYTFRGLVNALWVKENGTVPPISFVEAIEGLDVLPSTIVDELHKIITIKKEGREKTQIENIDFMDEYVEAFLGDENIPEARKEENTELLDKEIRTILL